MAPILEVVGITAGYGKIDVLRNVSLSVGNGEVVSLLGANGAGKSTTLRAIAGLASVSAGDIRFEGESVVGLPVYSRVRRGLVLVPEGRQLFSSLTVAENLRMGGFTRNRSILESDEICELFPQVRSRLSQRAGTLSGGQQQMVAIARGLMSKPRVLMLDEPSLGLAPKVVADVLSRLLVLKEAGLSMLLVEQNVQAALAVSDRGYVLENGEIVLEGTANELLSERRIQDAYMGR